MEVTVEARLPAGLYTNNPPPDIHSRGELPGTSGADSHHLGKMSTSAAKGKVLCLEPKHLLLGGFAHHHFPGLCLTIMGCDDGVLTGR